MQCANDMSLKIRPRSSTAECSVEHGQGPICLMSLVVCFWWQSNRRFGTFCLGYYGNLCSISSFHCVSGKPFLLSPPQSSQCESFLL